MTEYEAYQEHIRYTHDTYCRIVIRHASFDAARTLAARWKREISLEYLTEEKFVPLSTTDEYFQVPDYGETYPFSVRGQTILLDSCSLAAAAYASGCVYGSMPNDGLAKNIVCMPDMLLILFVFGHGKSPFLNNGRERQHFVLSPS